ncbi:MAG: TolC family protein [Bacteroidales bacterium]|nr:TolC family protein [Bacteroidales bacterium]
MRFRLRHQLPIFAVSAVMGLTSSVLGQPATPPARQPDPADSGDKPAPPPHTILNADEVPIDLGTALKLAGVENPELLLARQRVTEAVAWRQLAAAQILPNLNAGGNYNLHRGPLQQAKGNILNVNRDSLYYGLGTYAVGAGTVNIPGLNYNLNIGDAWFNYLSTRQRAEAAAAMADGVRNDVLLRVCLAYLELLRADCRRAIATQNRDDAVELARVTAAFAETGQGRKADADRAQVELQLRTALLTQTEADTLSATARLCQLLNLDPSTRLKPVEGWVVPASLVPDPTPLADLLAVAMMQRPELAARRAEVRAALYNLSQAKVLPFSPTLILGFSAASFGGGSNLISNPPGYVGGNGQLMTGPRFGDFNNRTDFDVMVFWTLRNLGVGNVAMIRAARSRARQSHYQELEMLNLVRMQVAESRALVQAGIPQMEVAEKAVKAGHEAFSQDLTRIKGGQGLPLEAVDSMRLLARSRFEYLNTIINYNQAHFKLWVALGSPPADMLARPIPTSLVPQPTGEMLPGPRVFSMPQTVPVP